MKRRVLLHVVNGSTFSLHFIQGGSVATSQSAETGSSTAMMDVDSMTSQVSYTVLCNTTQIGGLVCFFILSVNSLV